MKTIVYLFWRFCRFRKGKGKKEVEFDYFAALITLGAIITLIVINIFDFVPDAIRAEFLKKSIYAYVFWFICAFIFSLPFRLIFPKKKIESLIYTKEEERRYKLNSLYFVIGLVVLFVLRLIYVWHKIGCVPFFTC